MIRISYLEAYLAKHAPDLNYENSDSTIKIINKQANYTTMYYNDPFGSTIFSTADSREHLWTYSILWARHSKILKSRRLDNVREFTLKIL